MITGASRGLGLEIVKQLASAPYCQKIVASCRNPEEAETLIDLQKTNSSFSKQAFVHVSHSRTLRGWNWLQGICESCRYVGIVLI